MPRDPDEFFARLWFFAVTEDEQGCAGKTEEEHVDSDDIVQDLLVSSRHRDNRGPDTLQGYCKNRDTGPLAQPADGLEEYAVTSHRVIHAGGGENALA